MIDDKTIEIWLTRLVGSEGGYSNRSPEFDPGGETKYGISKRSYPHVGIKDLSLAGAIKIYKSDFIAPIVHADMTKGVAFQLFDFAVNSGIKTAIKQIQKVLNIKDDGIIGKVTKQKIKEQSESDLVMLILARRIRFMKSLKNWEANHDGWMERIASNLDYGAMDTD